MITHEMKTAKSKTKKVKTGGEGELREYRCLRQELEYCGHTLKKGDIIISDTPKCGKGVDLTQPHGEHPPVFELVQGYAPAVEYEPELPPAFDEDPRTKAVIAESLYGITGETISPARLANIRKDALVAMEKKALLERDKDGLTAVTEEI